MVDDCNTETEPQSSPATEPEKGTQVVGVLVALAAFVGALAGRRGRAVYAALGNLILVVLGAWWYESATHVAVVGSLDDTWILPMAVTLTVIGIYALSASATSAEIPSHRS